MCLSIEVNSPEKVLSKGEHLGFEWVTVHNGRGYRCGYLRVPEGHPWHGEDYADVDCDVHGGLTFAEADVNCQKDGPDNAWWLGFDCAHSSDAPDPDLPSNTEGMDYFLGRHGAVRSQMYVENECLSICEQAKEALQ